jgi:hypothetical protein
VSIASRRILVLVSVVLVAGASDGLVDSLTETGDRVGVNAAGGRRGEYERLAHVRSTPLPRRVGLAVRPGVVTVNQAGSSSGLYPGGPAAALAGTFTNPDPGPVNISSVTAAVRAFASHTVDASKPDCTQADFAIGGVSGANVVPSGTGVGSWSGLTVRLLDNGLNQDNCKSVWITIDYTANPTAQ